MLASLLAVSIATAASARAGTLEMVRARGTLKCGVIGGLPGMSILDSRGEWTGFHVDLCRAMGAAVFGDPSKVTFVTVTGVTRFTAMQTGEIDVLESVTALNVRRDFSLALTLPVVAMYTGQGVLVGRKLAAASLQDLNGATLCAVSGGEIEHNLADFATAHGINFNIVSYDADATLVSALTAGRCDAASNDMLSLLANQASLSDPAAFVLLPDLVAKEPHGPVVRADDLQWATLMRWVVFALVQAEELGLTRENVAERMQTDQDPTVRRFLDNAMTGANEPNLQKGWTAKVVGTAGNYGEIYERTAGAQGLKLDRGLNRLWTKGGMMMSWLW
ncbi:MAG: transporter substrate-binding domain-containing protein [Janthinobacterium lividum]